MHSPRREEEEEKRGLLKTLAAARNVVPPFLFVRPFEGEFSPNWEDRSRCSVTIFAIIPLPFLLCFFFNLLHAPVPCGFEEGLQLLGICDPWRLATSD